MAIDGKWVRHPQYRRAEDFGKRLWEGEFERDPRNDIDTFVLARDYANFHDNQPPEYRAIHKIIGVFSPVL